jgi:hypothetical protein
MHGQEFIWRRVKQTAPGCVIPQFTQLSSDNLGRITKRTANFRRKQKENLFSLKKCILWQLQYQQENFNKISLKVSVAFCVTDSLKYCPLPFNHLTLRWKGSGYWAKTTNQSSKIVKMLSTGTHVIASIAVDEVHKVSHNLFMRCEACLQAEGGHFQHLL